VPPTFTALPLALTVFPTQPPLEAPTAQPAPEIVLPQFPPPGTISNLAFTLNTANGFTGGALQMPGGTITLASDPANPNHIALVDARGLLFVFSDFANQIGARVETSPFSFPEPPSAETNQARVAQVAYAPNSAWIAFLVDTDSDGTGDNDSSNDGVYVLPVDPPSGQPTGGAVMLLRDCPPEPGCVIVNRPDAPYRYRSLGFAWSPSADALLIELELPEEGRRGLTLVSPAIGAATAQTRPPVLRYDYGAWSNDGFRLIVSGRDPDGRIVVGSVNRDGGDPQVREAAGIGLAWVQHAVQRPNGQIVMLGSPTGSASPMRLFTGDGLALTGDIGFAPPVRVAWSPDRAAVLVVTVENGAVEYYVAFVNGSIRRITPELGGALAVEWLNR
jgi:hypothetical protein